MASDRDTPLAALEQAMGTLRNEAVTVMAGLRAQGYVVLRAEPDADLRAALVPAIAHALAYADLPDRMETPREYAERLAPLVIESGYLAAASPDTGAGPE